ncbi:pyrimidine/purine nucleoside phosphorylase [Nocardioides humilatus]|uniref:Pyrimidine/purine nucleoside phosphorylase n=1 Tax=Nocardioides humilatus TaxID=2607660 RepID=A0A5B1LFP4_9ACTN|nr:pyrimidine/purine nucleoside phosphorylase [Nocardioides humilatus]KAA1419154.1 pyrimidine/purine nucleoside phosphorylase [Nocardioides humilatus]
MTYEGVTLDPQANIYFDGKCVSHTFFLADGTKKSAGVIFPATLNFGTAAPEVMELNAGRCRIRLAGAEDWNDYAAGESFSVPGDSSFDIQVLETLGYVCHYG